MNEFDNPDWNLAQVAAWVVYREAALVNQLDNPGQHDFGAIGLHKTMWPDDRKSHSTLDDLKTSLRNGSIKAYGYQSDCPNKLESVPKEAWADLHLRPPYAYKAENLTAQIQPWQNIRIDSSAVKKLWRRWTVPKRAVWSDGVIVIAPPFNKDLYFLECVKNFTVQ
jgi:hypothetical protein